LQRVHNPEDIPAAIQKESEENLTEKKVLPKRLPTNFQVQFQEDLNRAGANLAVSASTVRGSARNIKIATIVHC